MSIKNLSSSFDDAASYLSGASSLSKVSTAVKLELYGLFKYITVSHTPSAPRPSIFDMAGRAKWDAWSSASKKYAEAEDAKHRYLEIARDLGWAGESVAVPQSKPERSDPEGIWDDDDYAHRSGSNSGGMGGTVSAMPPPMEERDESLHGMAVSNDASGLSIFLERHPETDLNRRDEFGYTPLHLACDRGNLPVVEILLSKGANPAIKDPDDLSAAELARIAGHDQIQAFLSLPSLPS